MHVLVLCLLQLLNSVIPAEYSVYNQDGDHVGNFQYTLSKLVKRDIVKPGSSTIIQEDNHTYYKSKILTNSSAWVEINPESSDLDRESLHEGLSQTFRYAYNIPLEFSFPFYGIPLKSITPTTGGFIFVGELIHNQLTETQYIAPLMAEFNPALHNDSKVFYYSSETKVIVQWEHVFLDSMYDSSKEPAANNPFTFQVQLYPNGDIIFAYKTVPINPKEIDSSEHHVKVGIAEAFYEVDKSHGMTVTYIHEYHSVEVPLDTVKDSTEVQFAAETTCSQAQSCAACSLLKTTFNCSWCPGAQECSDGVSRYRQKWKDSHCNDDNVAITRLDKCPDEDSEALPAKDPKGSYEMVLCQESKTAVVCSGSDTLEIQKATFSVQNHIGSFCSRSTKGGACRYDDDLVYKKVSEKCNDHRTCIITASEKFFGSDPCPKKDKALNIYYKCNGSGTGNKILIGFIVVVLLSVLIITSAWGFYAYRNPTTPSGLWLIKYGRFWKSRAYKEDTAESGI